MQVGVLFCPQESSYSIIGPLLSDCDAVPLVFIDVDCKGGGEHTFRGWPIRAIVGYRFTVISRYPFRRRSSIRASLQPDY